MTAALDKLLAEIYGGNGSVGGSAGNVDLSKYKPGPGLTPVKGKSGDKGGGAGGAFHWILDKLARTGSASTGGALAGLENVQKNGNPLEHYGSFLKDETKGYWEGLSGNSHHTYKEVVNAAGYKGTGAGTLGFGLDLLTDPLSYAGGAGSISKVAKAATLAEEAGKGFSTTGKIARGLAEQSGAAPLARGAKTVGKTAAKLVTPTKKVVAEAVKEEAKLAAPVVTHIDEAATPAKHVAPVHIAEPKIAPVVSTELPKGLSGAKPNYNYGSKNFPLAFPDDVHKALYIVGGKGQSKSHAAYMDFLRGHFDSDGAIQNAAVAVRNHIKTYAAKGASGETIHVPSVLDKPKVAAPVVEPAVHPGQQLADQYNVLSPHNPNPVSPEDALKLEAGAKQLYEAEQARKAIPPKVKVAAKAAPKFEPRSLESITPAELDKIKKVANQRVDAKFAAGDKRPFAKRFPPELERAKQEFLDVMNKKGKLAHAKKFKVAETALPETTIKNAADIVEQGNGLKPLPVAEKLAPASAMSDKIAENAAKAQIRDIKAKPEYDGKLTAAAQANLYNKVLKAHQLKAGDSLDPAIRRSIADIYTKAEALVEAKGFKAIVSPHHVATGGALVAEDATPLRLSTLLPHLTPAQITAKHNYIPQILMGKSTDPLIQKLHEAAYAGAHEDDAQKIDHILKGIVDAHESLATETNTSKLVEALRTMEPDAVKAAKEAGASEVAVKTVAATAKQAVVEIKAEDPIAGHFVDISKIAEHASRVNAATESILADFWKAQDAALGLKYEGAYLKPAGRIASAFNLVKDDKGFLTAAEDHQLGLMAKYVASAANTFSRGFDNAMGFRDIQGAMAIRNSAKNMASAQVGDAQEVIAKLFKGVKSSDARLAFADAQAGRFDGVHGELAREIQQSMLRVFGQHGILRTNNVLHEDFSAYLRKSFYKGKNVPNPSTPFSLEHVSVHGKAVLDNPLDSWQHWKLPENGSFAHPGHYMVALEDAMYKSVAYRQMVSHAIHTFGSPRELPGLVQVDRGWFTKDIAGKVDTMFKSFSPEPKYTNQFLRGYDKLINAVKTGYTKYMPSHHINNSIGQFLLAFNDGLTSPIYYKNALKVLKNRLPEIDPNGLMHVGEGGDPTIMRIAGKDLKASDIWQMGTRAGIRQFHAIADDLETGANGFNRVSRAVGNAGNARENFHRFAHFMYALEQVETKGKTLEEIGREAGLRVNTIHGDYNDLTKFERTWAKRLIPFYTWQRKVGPIIFKQMITRPGRTIAYPKMVRDLSINTQNFDPWYDKDSSKPSYMQDLLQIPFGGGLSGGPRTPFSDVVGGITNHPLRYIEGSLSPVIKLGAEFATRDSKGGGTVFGSGGIPYKNFLSHAEDSIPYLNVAKRLTRIDPATGFGPTKDPTKNPDQQGPNLIALLNLLSASNLQETTESSKKAAAKGY